MKNIHFLVILPPDFPHTVPKVLNRPTVLRVSASLKLPFIIDYLYLQVDL